MQSAAMGRSGANEPRRRRCSGGTPSRAAARGTQRWGEAAPMSPDPALEALSAGAPVLVAGGGVTGRAVLAGLSRLGAPAPLCDDAPTPRRHFAETGMATEDSATAA